MAAFVEVFEIIPKLLYFSTTTRKKQEIFRNKECIESHAPSCILVADRFHQGTARSQPTIK